MGVKRKNKNLPREGRLPGMFVDSEENSMAAVE